MPICSRHNLASPLFIVFSLAAYFFKEIAGWQQQDRFNFPFLLPRTATFSDAAQ
jgi:hypothetical protein